MECDRIQEYLSAYLDDMLSSEERISVEEHLSSCGECGRAFSELKKTVQHIGEIEEVDPPSWLKQNVMIRVREEAGEKSIWQRLFYPLHVKLPIEAVGAVLVAVTALYIFQSVEPVLKGGRIDEVQLGRQEIPSSGVDRAPAREPGNVPAPEVPSSAVPKDRKDEAGVTVKTEAAGTIEEGVEDQFEAKATSREPLKKEEVRKKRKMIEDYAPGDKTDMSEPTPESKVITEAEEAPVPETDMNGIVSYDRSSAEGEAEHGAFSSEMRARQAMSGKVEREGVVLRVRDIKRSLRDVENIINELEGEIRRSDVFAKGSIISATVDKKNVGKLIDELSKLGELKDHADIPILKKNYTGEITIILESF